MREVFRYLVKIIHQYTVGIEHVQEIKNSKQQQQQPSPFLSEVKVCHPLHVSRQYESHYDERAESGTKKLFNKRYPEAVE